MSFFVPKNRLVTGIVASIFGAALFLFPMVLTKASPRPIINSSEALKSEAIRRGPFNNSGSKDIGPDPDWVGGVFRPHGKSKTPASKPTKSDEEALRS